MILSKYIIPIIIIAVAFLTIPLKEAFNFPSAQLESENTIRTDITPNSSVELIVQGVKCRGTANFFISRYNAIPGITNITAYASDKKVVIDFNDKIINLDKIKEIAEAPIQGQDGHPINFFKILKIDEK